MFLLDTMLIGGIRFVLDKLAAAVEQELNDDSYLREELIAAQMRVELGEMTPAEFDELEAAIFERLREIQERKTGSASGPMSVSSSEGMRVTGVEATFGGDEDELGSDPAAPP